MSILHVRLKVKLVDEKYETIVTKGINAKY